MSPVVSAKNPAVHAYHFHKMPDLNRATHRLLGRSGSGWTFESICRLVHHVGRVGRPKAKKAAREYGRLGVGIQAIADEAGVSVAKVRRDLCKLVDLGLVAVQRRNVAFHADPATGRIVENRTGRSLPVTVFITVGPEHCRTKAGQTAGHPSKPAPSNPSTVAGPAMHDRDHLGGAIQREEITKRRPDGDAVGIGSPLAVPEAVLTAGTEPATVVSSTGLIGQENGCQSLRVASEAAGLPAKAFQERKTLRVDEPDDDLPPPVGRIARPAGKASVPRQTGQEKKFFAEDKREPVAFVGVDADRFAATHRRLEAERVAREAANPPMPYRRTGS